MNQKNKKPFATLFWNKQFNENIPPAALQLEACYGDDFSIKEPGRNYNEYPRLLHGDNLQVMKALQPAYRESIDLIYCDPPFLTNKAYSARVGRNEDSRKPDEWDLARGYQDTWKDGAEYLDMLYTRLLEMYSLLSPEGTLYLHLDWHASSYARVMLDEIFGLDRLLNEIVWVYHGPSPIKSAFNRKHDTILVYTKTDDYIFNVDDVRVPYNPSTIKTFASSKKAGFGKKPNLKRGKVPEDWWYFPVVARLHNERTGYPTQKPLALLNRIVKASSNPDSIVADFFCGSGTTAEAAEQNGRRWIACDNTQLAVSTTYKRMLECKASPFTVWSTDTRKSQSSALSPTIKINLEDTCVQLSIHTPEQTDQYIQLVEVDWDYNGSVFHSKEQISTVENSDHSKTDSYTLTHTYQEERDFQIAVRFFDNQGRITTLMESLNTGK